MKYSSLVSTLLDMSWLRLVLPKIYLSHFIDDFEFSHLLECECPFSVADQTCFHPVSYLNVSLVDSISRLACAIFSIIFAFSASSSALLAAISPISSSFYIKVDSSQSTSSLNLSTWDSIFSQCFYNDKMCSLFAAWFAATDMFSTKLYTSDS